MSRFEEKRVCLSKGTKIYSRARKMEGYIITPLRVVGTRENLIAVRYDDRRVYVHSLEKDVENTIYPIDMYKDLLRKQQLPALYSPLIDRYNEKAQYERYRSFYHAYRIEVPDRHLQFSSLEFEKNINKDVLDVFKEGENLRDQIIEESFMTDYDSLAYSEWDP